MVGVNEVKVVGTQNKKGNSMYDSCEFILRKLHVFSVIHITTHPIASSKIPRKKTRQEQDHTYLYLYGQ